MTNEPTAWEPPPLVVLDPHPYTEQSARNRLQRRRARGEELVMREIDGLWFTGRLVHGEIVDEARDE